MDFDEQIKGFRAWAAMLGCPPSAIPTDDALRSIFKSSSSSYLFAQLQARIQPRQVVQEFRDDRLICQVEKHKDKVIPPGERKFLPQQLQNHLKMQDMLKEKAKAELSLAEKRQEYELLASSIKTKNIQLIRAKHKKEQSEAKLNILKFKVESLDKSLAQEQQTKAQILATMPVKLNAKNASEKLATKAVEQAHKELEKFYSICNDAGNNSQQLADAKPQLWSRMREIFANTPNVMMFQAIMKIKEQQLQHIMQLNKTSSNVPAKPPFDKFNVKLLQTKAYLLGMVSKHICAKKEARQLDERFAEICGPFVDELQKKVYSFNGISDDEDNEAAEEIISNYVLQHNMRNFYQASNAYLIEQIEQLRMEIESGAKQLDNHELLLGSIKQMYGEINTSVNRIQHDMLQFSQIKEKIIYSRHMLKNLLDDMQLASQNHNAKSHLRNFSMMGTESFNMANDSVLSSTKLDIDSNTSSRSFDSLTLMPGSSASTSSNSVLAAGTAGNLPCHLIELNTFYDMSLDKLSCLPGACEFLVSANPLIVERQELASTMQLAPGHLLTPHGALQEVRKRILWASSIDAHSSNLKLNLEPIIVNPHELKLKARRQHNEIVQLLDNIDALGVKTHHQLQKAKRIYEFILNNPLRKYVPANQLYNNATYAAYESEFKLYYRIATSGGSM